MDNKQRKKVIVVNLLLLAALFLLITVNKEHIRPLVQDNPLALIITGCFPNFIAAYIISLAVVMGVMTRKPRYARQLIYGISFLIFCILTLEEIKPMWGASTHYDIFDIFASGLGSILAVITYEIISAQNKQKTKIPHS